MTRPQLLLAFALALSGCLRALPAPAPMRSVQYPASDSARCLMVLFPGVGDRAESFAEHGFIEAMKESRLAVDVVAADATLGYYVKETLWPRVELDVIEPARSRGYQKTWFVGISMGGMGAILTALRELRGPDGLLLLAPFLGDKPLLQEISDAGGLQQWEPGPLDSTIGDNNYQRHAWRWLKTASAQNTPNLFLAYGTEDRLESAARVLAGALPESQVDRVPGQHKWTTWKELWARFLARSTLAEQCGFIQAR